jgi:hypothetical protein
MDINLHVDCKAENYLTSSGVIMNGTRSQTFSVLASFLRTDIHLHSFTHTHSTDCVLT